MAYSRHVRYTLELVIDDQLRDELDKTKHVDCLREGRHDERVPRAVRTVVRAVAMKHTDRALGLALPTRDSRE